MTPFASPIPNPENPADSGLFSLEFSKQYTEEKIRVKAEARAALKSLLTKIQLDREIAQNLGISTEALDKLITDIESRLNAENAWIFSQVHTIGRKLRNHPFEMALEPTQRKKDKTKALAFKASNDEVFAWGNLEGMQANPEDLPAILGSLPIHQAPKKIPVWYTSCIVLDEETRAPCGITTLSQLRDASSILANSHDKPVVVLDLPLFAPGVVVTKETKREDIAQMMETHNVDLLPIVNDDQELIGVVTKRAVAHAGTGKQTIELQVLVAINQVRSAVLSGITKPENE